MEFFQFSADKEFSSEQKFPMKQPTIRFLIPYFGKWPKWMPFFVETLRWNPSIDWYFFTDCGPIPNCPENIRVFHTTFALYCKRVSEALGIDFKPDDPYKLCDLKPAYGFIHQQELDGIDFWGFGDIDVVMGDLRAYFSNKRLSKKDIFSTHARRISGHMCLIRNTPELNKLFMKIKDWQVLFTRKDHQALDEGAFTRIFLQHKNLPRPVSSLLSYLSNPYFRRAEFTESFSTPNAKIPWLDGSRNYPILWSWHSGILKNDINKKRGFPYLHFFVWKSTWKGNGELDEKTTRDANIKSFRISAAGFFCDIDPSIESKSYSSIDLPVGPISPSSPNVDMYDRG